MVWWHSTEQEEDTRRSGAKQGKELCDGRYHSERNFQHSNNYRSLNWLSWRLDTEDNLSKAPTPKAAEYFSLSLLRYSRQSFGNPRYSDENWIPSHRCHLQAQLVHPLVFVREPFLLPLVVWRGGRLPGVFFPGRSFFEQRFPFIPCCSRKRFSTGPFLSVVELPRMVRACIDLKASHEVERATGHQGSVAVRGRGASIHHTTQLIVLRGA